MLESSVGFVDLSDSFALSTVVDKFLEWENIACFIVIDREEREIMYLVASVCPSVRPSFNTLTAELFDLRP